MHIRLVNVYLLNVHSVSSPYFNIIKRTSHFRKWHALSLEILCNHNMFMSVFIFNKARAFGWPFLLAGVYECFLISGLPVIHRWRNFVMEV